MPTEATGAGGSPNVTVRPGDALATADWWSTYTPTTSFSVVRDLPTPPAYSWQINSHQMSTHSAVTPFGWQWVSWAVPVYTVGNVDGNQSTEVQSSGPAPVEGAMPVGGITPQVLAVGSVVISSGLALWVARSSVLMSSLMASLPIWQRLDPLVVYRHNERVAYRRAHTRKRQAQADGKVRT